MMHLEDGTLQAFLDQELPPAERAEAAEHLLGCESCHGSYQALMRANALFSQSVSVLDVEPAGGSSALDPFKRGARVGTSSFVKAAGLVMALAAAASAAVPGSPVRVWIESAVSQEEATPPQTRARRTPVPPPVEEPAPPPPVPAGLSLTPSGDPVLISLHSLDGVEIHLDLQTGNMAEVSVAGGEQDPLFGTGSDRIDVRGGQGGELRVRLPGAGGRLEADGRLLAEMRGGVLTVHAAADTVDGTIVWR